MFDDICCKGPANSFKWCFDVENPREFQEKFCLPVDAFIHILELIGPRLEHRTRRNRPLTARQQLLVFLHFLGTNSFHHIMHSCHGISTSTVWHIHRVVPVILSFKREFIRWPDQPLSIAAKFRDIAVLHNVNMSHLRTSTHHTAPHILYKLGVV